MEYSCKNTGLSSGKERSVDMAIPNIAIMRIITCLREQTAIKVRFFEKRGERHKKMGVVQQPNCTVYSTYHCTEVAIHSLATVDHLKRKGGAGKLAKRTWHR